MTNFLKRQDTSQRLKNNTLDHYQPREEYISGTELLELALKSNWRGTVQLTIHLVLLAGTFGIVAMAESWWLVPAWLLYGTILMFLFSPLHECIHNTAFRTRSINSRIATAIGFVLFLPANYFRFFHFEHHRYTNDPTRDPELASGKPDSKLQYLIALTGLTSYWKPQIQSIALHALGRVPEAFIPESHHSNIILEARVHVALYFTLFASSLLTQSPVLLIYWIVPALIGSISLRLFLLAEHTDCELCPDMRRNTRTTLTNPLMKFLTWNMPYHSEHHLYPAVPFHALPKLHDKLRSQLEVVSHGYFHFNRTLFQSLGNK